jgi:glycosyltransferase involved in cell wall biosynthesis
MKVSVIIPSYNSEKTIYKCLESLKTQSYQGEYEIIIVDSSTDKTPVIVRNEFPGVHYFQFKEKTDPGTARNYGVQNAIGEVILFIDSDCIAEPNWIQKIVSLHLIHPEVAAIGGAVLNSNSSESAASWASYMSEFREFIPENSAAYVHHIPTLNISYKRWVFDKFGYFNSHFYPQEDLLYNYHLFQNQCKILFDPDILVWHTHRSTLISFLRHQYRIGFITARVLKIIPLPGHYVVTHKTLYFFTGLFLPMVKFIRTVVVFLKKNPLFIFKHVLSVFILKIGLIYWFIGFTQGVYSSNLGKTS